MTENHLTYYAKFIQTRPLSTLHDAQDGFEGREGHRTPFASAKKYRCWPELLTSNRATRNS
jgi:hypothetical protein